MKQVNKVMLLVDLKKMFKITIFKSLHMMFLFNINKLSAQIDKG